MDVVLQPLAEGAAGVTVQDISAPYSLVVINNLRNSAIALGNPVTDFNDVGGTGYAVILLIRLIPRSVTAKYEPLHNTSLSRTGGHVH